MDFCHKEEEIVAAVIADNLTEAQSGHLANCANCRSAAAIAGMMQAERKQSLARYSDIPAPDILWIKAAYERHRKQYRLRKAVIIAGTLMAVIVGIVTSIMLWPSGGTFALETIIPRLNLSAKLFFPAAISAVIIGLMLYIEHMSNPPHETSI